MNNKPRPLSPHLQIYKPQISSVLSISHRLSGIILYIGILVMSWVLVCNIYCGSEQNYFADLLEIKVIKILLYIWILSMYYHFSNGIRHLFWDIGKGFDIKTMNTTGMLVVATAILMTIITFIITEM